jgi:hypothetical protein
MDGVFGLYIAYTQRAAMWKSIFFDGGGSEKGRCLWAFLAFCCGCCGRWSVYMWLLSLHPLRLLLLLLVSFGSCSAPLLRCSSNSMLQHYLT